jgi:membrane protease YdiL (CAAX protease family)
VVSLHWLLGSPAPRFFQAEGVPQGNILLVLAGLFLSQVLLRGIGEETGWRGYALPALLKRHNAFIASLILGVLWAAWHFHPANFSSLLSLGGLFTFLKIVGSTVIITWVYLHTRGSILIVILFHTLSNLADYVIPIEIDQVAPAGILIQIAVTWVVIGVLLWKEGKGLGAGSGASE